MNMDGLQIYNQPVVSVLDFVLDPATVSGATFSGEFCSKLTSL
jgi:hypothetical protein